MTLSVHNDMKTEDPATGDGDDHIILDLELSEKNVEHREQAENVTPHGSDSVTEEPEEEYRFTIGQFLAMAVRNNSSPLYIAAPQLSSVLILIFPVGDAVGLPCGGILYPDDFCHSDNDQ